MDEPDLLAEDNAPVNIYTEKQQRLLTEPLYSSWGGPGEGRPFLALANVRWFHTIKKPPLVPDVLLSLDVTLTGSLRSKEGCSYFQWLLGQSPDVIIEIVSDHRGGEENFKKRSYARLGAVFYGIYDPNNILEGGVLRAYALNRGQYEPVAPGWFPNVGLGLTLWQGMFEGQQETWLRWCDQNGQVIPTGAERAEEERRRAEEKLQRLAAQLRALGVEPEI